MLCTCACEAVHSLALCKKLFNTYRIKALIKFTLNNSVKCKNMLKIVEQRIHCKCTLGIFNDDKNFLIRYVDFVSI